MLLLIAAAAFLFGTAQAQVKLNFRNIVLSWPNVRLDFSVKCKGAWSNSFEKQHFRVWEDSVQVGEFELLCPNSTQRCRIAVAIVLDASGSMAGDKNYATRQAANVFVENMDGVDDRAAVLWFDSRDTLVQVLTTDKALLRKAIDSLPSGGTTAIWDATYAGIRELVTNGSGFDTCGAVIVLTDGNDNASMRSLGELVSYAVSQHTRVYTVGLGEDANEAALSHLAGATQGKYFRVLDLAKLGDIYQDIFMDVAGIENCSITYTSSCPDGTARRVDLELLNFCGGGDSRWLSFTAPNFPFNPEMVDIAIGDTSVKENETVLLPVQLLTPLEPMSFPISTVTVSFDTSVLAFEGLGPLNGCLLQHAGLTAQQLGNTVLVRSAVRTPVQGAGTLFRLRFKGRALDKTTCGPVNPVWEFTAGCLKARTTAGEVCVTTKTPDMRCTIDIPPDIRWDARAKDYVPNPIRVAGMWINHGEKVATGVAVTIACDPKRAVLLAPTSEVQAPASGVIAPGDTLRTEWLVRLLPRGERDTAEFCLRATFANAPALQCCARIRVDAAGPALRCTIALPALRADSVRLRYEPSPLDLVVTVSNAGGTAIDSITVALVLPPEVRMADGLDAFLTPLTPRKLYPGEQGMAQWRLRVPLRNLAAIAQIAVIATSRQDTSRCEETFAIPALHAPMLDAECSVPARLVPDTVAQQYRPDPFDVQLRVHNDGDRDATGLAATLLLPDGVELADAREPLTKPFSPSVLAAHTTGSGAAALQWRVRMARRSTSEAVLPFRWLVHAQGPGGTPLDTIFAVCTSTAGAFPADLLCSLEMPSRATASADSTRIEPDAFVLRGVYRNMGSHSLILKRVLASVSADGMRFDASTPPLYPVERALLPGDSVECVWRVHIEPRTYPRRGDCSIVGIDDQRNEVRCDGSMQIDGIPAELACDLALSHDTVRVDAESGMHLPDVWFVRATVTNYGKRTLSNVSAALRRDMAMPIDPVPSAGDTASVKRSTLVFPGQSRVFSWPFRLRDGDTTTRFREARFLLDIGSSETVTVAEACAAAVWIAPSRVPQPELVCALTAPDTLRASDTAYAPSPFAIGLRVRNLGGAAAKNCRAYLLMNTHFSAASDTQLPLGDIGAHAEQDLSDAFLLRALPLPAGETDTLRVSIVSDNLPPLLCAAVVRIEAARYPALRIECAALPDTIRYDSLLRRYVPDTIALRAVVTNIGTAPAGGIVVSFSGSSAFVPLDSSTSVEAGGLLPGASVMVTEHLRAVPSGGGRDTLGVSAYGSGGFGNSVVSASCVSGVVRIGAPASRYELTCGAPDTVRPSAGEAQTPFLFTSRVHNAGSQSGMPGALVLTLPAGVQFEAGETPDKSMPALQAGKSATVAWRLLATPGLAMRALDCCVSFQSAAGDSLQCCSRTMLAPAPEEASLVIECDIPDSLHLAAGQASYADAPFPVCVRVRNTGLRPVTGIVVRVRALSSRLIIQDASPIAIPGLLAPGAISAPVCWLVSANPSDSSALAMLRCSIDGASTTAGSCVREVFLPGTALAHLSVSGTTTPPDTLHFIQALRDYEGVPSARGAYRVFALTATVRNEGASSARRPRLQLLPPAGIAFEEGESAEKTPAIDSLPPGATATVSWLLTASRRRDGASRRFLVRAHADNAAAAEVPVSLFVQGGPMRAGLRIPDSLTAHSGDILTVPVEIDPSYFGPVASYRILVSFDPRLLRLRDARSTGTLTETGWDGPKYAVVEPDSGQGSATVVLSDSTSRLPLSAAGTLAFLRFDVQPLPAHALLTDVTFPSERVLRDGSVLRDALNGRESTSDGDVAFDYENGVAGLSDGCATTLAAGPGFVLFQNSPNPFNPSTEIRCRLPHAGLLRLSVFDTYGRVVRVLADGAAEAGEHRFRFDAGGLAAGVYLCRLDAAGGTATIRMLLLK